MSINAIDSLMSAANTAPANPTKKGADKDMFMTLLVAQLKNQDPLAPQDGAQFVAQLAQFNSLEQLVSINKRLGELLDGQSAAAVRQQVSQVK